jgi:uncharacterized membrane protein
MLEWLGFALAVGVVGGLFWLAVKLLGRSQRDDAPYKRGQDSSEPGGLYTDTSPD